MNSAIFCCSFRIYRVSSLCVLERFSAPRGMKNHGTICLFLFLNFSLLRVLVTRVGRVVQPNASLGISQAPTSGRYACYLYTIPFFHYQFRVVFLLKFNPWILDSQSKVSVSSIILCSLIGCNNFAIDRTAAIAEIIIQRFCFNT